MKWPKSLTLSLFLGILSWLLAFGTLNTVGATDIVNNLGQPNTRGETFRSGKFGAQAFQTGSQQYALDSITVKLANLPGSGLSVAGLFLCKDNDGTPGAAIENLGTINMDPVSSVNYVRSSTAHPVLAADTKYWVVLTHVFGGFHWRLTSSTTGSESGTLLPDDLVSDHGTSWSAGSSENFFIAVSGNTVTPEIAIRGNGVSIDNGDTTPATGAHTDFGSASMLSGTVARTFTIENSGLGTLTLGSVTVSGANMADFTVTTQPATTVAAGGSTTFQITFDPSASGLRTASLSLVNNDADENPFTFSIQGLGIIGEVDALDTQIAGSFAYTSAIQPDGKILLGGSFTTVAGVARANLARLNGDGSLDTGFNPGTDNTVYNMSVQADGKILLGGAFGTVAGTTRAKLARLHRDGSLDPNFNPAPNNTVVCLAVQADGKILLGGTFTTVADTTRNYLARLNADGSLDTGFNPGTDNNVYSLAVQADGKILVGGFFTAVAGTARAKLARLNADGSLDTSFNPVPDGTVYSLAVQADGKILLGGFFTAVAGTERSKIARLNADGSLDTSFNPGASSTVESLAVQADGKILLGGSFSTVAGTARPRIARLNKDGTLDLSFNPNSGGIVNGVMLQADGQVLMSGTFTTVGGITRNRFARLLNDAAAQTLTVPSAAQILWIRSGTAPEVSQVTFENSTDGGTTWTLLGSGMRIGTTANWQINGLDLSGNGQVRARGRTSGGHYTASFGLVESTASYSHLSEIAVSGNGSNILMGDLTPDMDDHTDFGSQPIAAGSLTRTFTIQNQGTGTLSLGTISFGGLATNDFIVTVPPAASVAAGGNTAFQITFDPRATGLRQTILSLPNNDADKQPFIFAIQGLGTGPGTADSFEALIDGTDPGYLGTSYIYASIVQPDGKIILAGSFNTILGAARQNIARLNADGTLDENFNPNPNDVIYSVALQADGKIIIGGRFTALQPNEDPSPTLRNHIARLNGDGTVDASFDPNADNDVLSILLQASGKIVIGGRFTSLQPNGMAAPISRWYIARLNADGTVDPGLNPGPNGAVFCLAEQSDGKIVFGGGFFRLGYEPVDYILRYNIARLNTDGTLDLGFAPTAGYAVYCLAVQPDGKILLGGAFTSLRPGGTGPASTRNYIARVNSDGTLDASFAPSANNTVVSMGLQADGKILFGGTFQRVDGNPRNYLARLNPNGTVDPDFNPNVSDQVLSLSLQADGQILIGGLFTSVGGSMRDHFARLANDPATRAVSIPDFRQVLWARSGTAPEVSQVTFEKSIDGGTTWILLGNGARVGATANWQITGLRLIGSGLVRAQGRTSGGFGNASSGLVETVGAYSGFIAVTVARTGGGVEISWPMADSGALILQSTSSLHGTPVWETETAAPAVRNDEFVVAPALGSGNRFFRLAPAGGP